MSRFQVYEDESGDWRWRLLARNGRILADSAEGYATRWTCLRAINTVRDTIPGTDTPD